MVSVKFGNSSKISVWNIRSSFAYVQLVINGSEWKREKTYDEKEEEAKNEEKTMHS